MILRALLAAAVLSLQGCSSASKPGKTSDPGAVGQRDASGIWQIDRISIDQLRVRRPSGPGADPDAGPGGADYRGQPPPDDRLDCREISELFAKVSPERAIACLKSVAPGTEVIYRLRRDPVPELALMDPEDLKGRSACLARELPSLPIPREIVFQDKNGDCYTSRLDIEADRVLGIRLPLAKLGVEVKFPLETPLPGEDALKRLLASWVMTPFWNSETGTVPGRYLTRALCEVCIGKTNLLKKNQPPRLWP